MERRNERAAAWTRDDILLATVETYSLLPRPSGSSTNAFITLLREYWRTASRGTRIQVEAQLRGCARLERRVLEALDELTDARVHVTIKASDANVSVRHPRPLGARREAEPAEPPLRAAEHARSVLRHLSATGEPGPAVQIDETVRRLRETDMPWVEMAVLLRLPSEAGNWIIADARGTAVALRALGIGTRDAKELVDRWHHGAPEGFVQTYEALPLEECLDIVGTWRRSAQPVESGNTDVDERKAG